MAYQYKYVKNYIQEIKSLCPANRYVLVLHKHLGNVFYAIGAKDEFKNIYGESLFFIVRPQHEFLMKLWQVRDYAIYDLDKIIKKNTDFKKNYFKNRIPAREELDRLENEFFQAIFPCIPTKDLPFVCENPINNFFSYNRYWCYRWATNMGIEEKFRFSLPKGELPVSKVAQECITKLGGVEKIVLIAPEAATAVELPPEWWAVICSIANSKGYKILVNSNRIRLPYCNSAFDFGLSLEDVVAIGLRCHTIFALRSGLCDVLVGAGKRLYVISPAMLRREEGSLSIPFDEYTGVREFQLKDWTFPKLIWEGENVGEKIQLLMDVNRCSFWKECALSLFKPKSRHVFWKHVFNNVCGRAKIFPENNIENPLSEKIVRYKNFVLYSSKSSLVDNQKVHVRTIFNGMIKSVSTPSGVRKTCFGIPFYSLKKKSHKIVKIIGIPVVYKDRQAEFLNYIKNAICSFENKYTDVIILRHNIGENVIYLGNLREWIKTSQMKRAVVVVWRKKDIPFYNLFCGKDVPVEYVPMTQADINFFLREPFYNISGANVYTPTYRIAESMKEKYENGENVNFVNYIENSISIKSGKFLRPVLSNVAFKVADSLLRQYEVTGKYIVLFPEATTLTSIDKSFWMELGQKLQSKGYTVIVNNVFNENFIPGAIQSSLPIDALYALTVKSNGFISLASGLAVLLSLSCVKGDLIYTPFKSKSIGYTAEMASKIYSIHNINTAGIESVNEHIYNKVCEGSLLSEILNRY